MEKRNTKTLAELLHSSPRCSEDISPPLYTGEEILTMEKELEPNGGSFYNVHGVDVVENAIYQVRLIGNRYAYSRIAFVLAWRDIMNKIAQGNTFIYKGMAYHSGNRSELPKWEDRISVVDYSYEGEKYLFVEEDIAQNIIEENQKKIEKERKELEMKRYITLQNRNLMISISLGAEKFPQRAY